MRTENSLVKTDIGDVAHVDAAAGARADVQRRVVSDHLSKNVENRLL